MRRIYLFVLIMALAAGFAFLFSCKSVHVEPLDQEKAQEVIRKYVANHGFEHNDELVTALGIQKMDPPEKVDNVRTGIRVYFKKEGSPNPLILIYYFDQLPDGRWILNAVKSSGMVSNDLADWLAKKNGLNITVR